MGKEKSVRESSVIPGIKYKKIPLKELKTVLKKAKNGDQESFNRILCHMHNYLCFLMTEFFIQGSESQDLYQEGAIKLVNVIDKFDGRKGSFTSFAQSSIRKHIITTINKEKAYKRSVLNNSYSLDNAINNEEGESVTFIDLLADDSGLSGTPIGNPLDVIQRDYERFLIEEIAKSLSEMEAKVFVLRFIKGLSYKDVAREIGLWKKDRKTGERVPDQKSVDNAIWRSRPKIKKALERLKINPGSVPFKEKRNAKNSKI